MRSEFKLISLTQPLAMDGANGRGHIRWWDTSYADIVTSPAHCNQSCAKLCSQNPQVRTTKSIHCQPRSYHHLLGASLRLLHRCLRRGRTQRR